MKTLADFTDDERRVIRERHYGFERAVPGDLARIFGTHPNTIAAILRLRLDPHSAIPAGRGGLA